MNTSTLTIDGKKYLLAYDFNSIADAEAVAGCNLFAALQNLNAISCSQLRGLLYAAIVVTPPDPPPTLAQAGALIRLNTIETVTLALAEAYQLSMPEPAKPADPPAAPKPPDAPEA
jgi:hypothetical protein